MTGYIVGNVPKNCHPKGLQLVLYWRSIHPKGALPGRQHFDPCDVPTLLSQIYLLDVCPGRPEFVFRIMGTGLVSLFGQDYTGQPFIRAYKSGKSSHSYRDILDMLVLREPRWRKANALFAEQRDHLILERLVLPLARDGENVDMVLGMIIARTVSGEPV